MKKLFLVFIAVFSFIAQASAQSSMLATLNHEGNITTFYGTTALREAHAAAVHGDVITLSSGSFVSTDITKAITLRGAGMELDTIHGTEPTVISGDFTINIADTIEHRLTIEGIYNNNNIFYAGILKNAIFLKNRFHNFDAHDMYSSTHGVLKNATFIHCRIAYSLRLAENSSASCLSCMIQDAYTNNSLTSNFELINCIIRSSVEYLQSSTLKNCVIANTDYSYNYLHKTSLAYNCIAVNVYTFNYIPNSTNTIVEDLTTVFKTYNGENLEKLDSENFELTDEAKTKYLGMDGTQVGIYGGSLPFTSVPTNPQITKCNVAAKSTADGKLSVDIEVKAAE